MARKQHHEEHANHEAWAIPYGDLVTLLLAFFVVMYAVSSVNEGKYRVLADAMAEAFGGPPKTISPLQLGTVQQRGSNHDQPTPVGVQNVATPVAGSVRNSPQGIAMSGLPNLPQSRPGRGNGGYERQQREKLSRIAREIEDALKDMIDADMVTVRRVSLSLEIEIKTDILFASGSAALNATARDTLTRVGEILRTGQNPVRIEGHTDDRPIRTYLFPSNWELSAARAASVVHLLEEAGVPPMRLAVMGWADQRPRADNETDAGRNENRRVVIVVMADGTGEDPVLRGRIVAASPADAMVAPPAADAAARTTPVDVSTAADPSPSPPRATTPLAVSSRRPVASTGGASPARASVAYSGRAPSG